MTIKVKKAKTLPSRVKGLIGKKEIEPLLIETRFGIHTVGMKRPIDVVVLNMKKEIVSVKEKLYPNRVFLWNPRYKTVIELPPNFVQKNELKIGDTIKLEVIE